MHLIDTHCHYNHERMEHGLTESLTRADAAEVREMIVVGYDLASSERAVRLAEAHPDRLWAAIGLHPHDAKDWNTDAEAQLNRWSDHARVVAIGEIGLDYYRNLSPPDAQEKAFRAQMRLALRAALPVIIHCRDAYAPTLQILRDEGADETGGVMHCWAGELAQAHETADIGLALGFGGTLTYKKADNVRDAARAVPLEHLLLETDAPYLTPEPFRGKPNEPAFTRLVAEQLADLRGLTLDEIAVLTTSNARRIFPRLTGAG